MFLHQEKHWFLKNSALDAPSFFGNIAGNKPGPYRDNRAGFDISGPVRLPGYKGKGRTFFFYTFERNIWANTSPTSSTFGRVSSLAWSGRQLQFALKVRF